MFEALKWCALVACCWAGIASVFFAGCLLWDRVLSRVFIGRSS